MGSLTVDLVAAKPVQVGRKLRVNGQNLLSLEYDRDSKTMGVFLEDHIEILNVTYDRTARPVKWIPKYVDRTFSCVR